MTQQLRQSCVWAMYINHTAHQTFFVSKRFIIRVTILQGVRTSIRQSSDKVDAVCAFAPDHKKAAQVLFGR